MAGFLGTLFMGNVGLRLLLPPKSAYNKMAQEFGAGAKKMVKTNKVKVLELKNKKQKSLYSKHV